MLTTLFIHGIKALIGITIVLTGWMLVQVAWRRVFCEGGADEDPLQGRMGCHGCKCHTPCHEANQKTVQ